MTSSAVTHYLAPSTLLRTESAKRAHLRAAEQALEAGANLTLAGLPAPTIFPPWYAIGGQSRYAIANQETT